MLLVVPKLETLDVFEYDQCLQTIMLFCIFCGMFSQPSCPFFLLVIIAEGEKWDTGWQIGKKLIQSYWEIQILSGTK